MFHPHALGELVFFTLALGQEKRADQQGLVVIPVDPPPHSGFPHIDLASVGTVPGKVLADGVGFAAAYLQASLQQENLPLLKELLQDPEATDPKQKEDLMKYVTELAGRDQQASADSPRLLGVAEARRVHERANRGRKLCRLSRT